MEATNEQSDIELEQIESKKQEPKTEAKLKDKKFEEVNNLMSKYDNAEKRIKWLNSPEYAQQQAL